MKSSLNVCLHISHKVILKGPKLALMHISVMFLQFCIYFSVCRADNSLQDIRAKLFPSGSKKVKARVADRNLQDVGSKNVLPSETRKAKAPEVGVPSISSPGRKKQRYLSSLVTSTPTVTTRSSTSGRRYFTRKSSALQESPLSIQEEPVHKHEDFPERLKSSENLKEDAVYTRQVNKRIRKRN